MSIQIAPGACFHCGLPNDVGNQYPATILNKQYMMCCPGCQAVAKAIVDAGLERYYQFRTEPAARGDAALDDAMAELAVYDEPALQEEFVLESGDFNEIQLTVENITCAACGWLIEKQLSKIEGIRQVSVNVGARRANISWYPATISLSKILKKLKLIGYNALPFQADQHESSYHREHKRLLKKLGLAGLMTMQVMMLAMGQYFDLFGNLAPETIAYFNWISLLLTTPVVLYSGSVFYLSALRATAAGTVNMDIPVTIAIVATYIAGILAVRKETGEVYFESICMFIFFLLISRFLEHRGRHKASQSSSNMLKLIPVTAHRWNNEKLESVLAKQLKVNDKVLIKQGETIPVDGVIIEGHATVDEAMLTGEFVPNEKTSGMSVYGGTIVQSGSITVSVTHQLKHAMVNQILRLQETAMAAKPKVAQVADKLSRYFVLAVLVISATSYTYWTINDNPHAFWICISILVATCPCALGLATPSALTCAMAKLNKAGILLKRADALEQLTHTTDIVFDKTGTLTEGKFSIQHCHIFAPAEINQQQALNIAASLELRADHPIASAFDTSEVQMVEDFDLVIGKGISGRIDGVNYQLGSASFVGIESNQNSEISHYNVFLARQGQVLAAFNITDSIKQDVPDLLAGLSMYNLVMLSGDSQTNVQQIADNLGINTAIGAQTPDMKLSFIQQSQQAGKSIVMLGDGINDAPVLAASDVSIAVGNASDLARNAADVILLNKNLAGLPYVLEMGRRTKRKIKQNIAWALGYNISVLPFAVMGVLTPWQAALGMSLSSIIVVYNSTRLLK